MVEVSSEVLLVTPPSLVSEVVSLVLISRSVEVEALASALVGSVESVWQGTLMEAPRPTRHLWTRSACMVLIMLYQGWQVPLVAIHLRVVIIPLVAQEALVVAVLAELWEVKAIILIL